MTKRLRQIPSDRELYRRLWNDPTLRIICDIEEREKPYHPSQLTRFRTRVGPKRLERIIAGLVEARARGPVVYAIVAVSLIQAAASIVMLRGVREKWRGVSFAFAITEA
jgi:hypothetical protein